jgi:hypothetical protein
LKRGTPSASGFTGERTLGDLGRARRFALPDARELWRMAAGDRSVAERLERLGSRGVGGFVVAGEDDEGVWLVRAPLEPTLARWMKEHDGPRPWRDVLRLAISLGERLAVCERESLFPGTIAPRVITVTNDLAAELRADGLVGTLVGATGAAGASPGESASPRWIAPEQAMGAPPDNAANRYVFGLILYRMLSGEHAFQGRGLRLGLEEQAQRPPAPFAEAIASGLPPGLQSFCLQLLDPDRAQRPRTAQAIVERLQGFLDPSASRVAPGPRSASSDDEPPPASEVRPRAKRPERPRSNERLRSLAYAIVPIAGGLALGGILLSMLGSPSAKPEAASRSLTREPISANTTLASDCASCHPRQAGEWHRSVMAHSVKSPMFQSLEMLIEEQVGKDRDCPDGAGILRRVNNNTACRDRASGLPITGSGGEHWCVNCHSPSYNLRADLPAWDGIGGDASSRQPLRDLLSDRAMEGISCGFCHQVHGPVRPGDLARGGYEGNPFWTSIRTGERFSMRPEDNKGKFGIANSGYSLDPSEIVSVALGLERQVQGGVHARPTDEAKAYLGTSEFCGACHDVRLFGTDVIGVSKGEHFKRLRNAYSEWVDYSTGERRAGREAASCQGCHMSAFPGICEKGDPTSVEDLPQAIRRACPPGTHFVAKKPGTLVLGRSATSSTKATELHPHYFSGIDVPLADEFPDALMDEKTTDLAGIPLGAKQRRDLLLAAALELSLETPRIVGRQLEVPIVVENVGGGHRVPAGFSQEREIWVHLTVKDGRGDVAYEVGRVDRDDEDLRDKSFLRINTDDRFLDGAGRPLGVFGADVADGPDIGRWSPNPNRGGTTFRGRGLANFQNGFLRCVVCIGVVDSLGRCQPAPGQERARADRFADGAYDIDTGECKSNLFGEEALFETYFPVGALDATRGVLKGPDAIIDTRSLPPKVPIRYVYELETRDRPRPFRVEARLMFRAFPPYLVRAFIDYEERQARAGKRPSGPLMTKSALARLEVVEIAKVRAVVR